MPVRMLNFLKERPPRRLTPDGVIKQTDEWHDTIMALEAGLKPQEFVEVYFPPEHRIHQQSKHPLSTLRYALSKKVKELNLPYDVYERAGKIYIVGRGVNIA